MAAELLPSGVRSSAASPVVVRTVAASNVRYLVDYAVRRGLGREEVLHRFEIDPAGLADVDGRVPLATYVRLWQELPALTDDPDMPLHVLESAMVAEPPLALLVFQSAPDLGTALRALVRYERLNFDVADEPLSALVEDGPLVHVVLDDARAAFVPPSGAVLDSFRGMMTVARMATQHPIEAVQIQLRHPWPADPARYEAALFGPIEFAMPRDRLTLRREDLNRPHPLASRVLAALVTDHAERKLSAMSAGEDLWARVRAAIRDGLPAAAVGLSEISAAVDLSPRTLQRRLREGGTSLRELVDEQRRQIALRRVCDDRTSLTEVALLLGFSELSVFSRAFVRWTGCSPREYRRRHG